MPPDSEKTSEKDNSNSVLKGTTLAVYRFIFRRGEAVGPHEIQRGLGLSSPSVASYHLEKLLRAGLIREVDHGYAADKVVFENIIRFRRLLIPVQASFLAFFATAILVLLTVLRPPVLYPAYYFSLLALIGAFAVSVFEAKRSMSKRI
jgi:predicted DNA-binding transcriptional regulator